MTKTLLLLLILLLAFFMALIPHIGYAYPLHVDEWTHLTYAKTVVGIGSMTFPDPFTGRGPIGLPGNNVALGFYILWAIFQQVSGIDWLLLWRFGPAVIFMLTVLCVYIFANKQGYGLEAAFFTCLIPTTVGLLGPAFMVPMAQGLLFLPLSLFIAFNVKSWPSHILLLLIACFLWSQHPPTAAIILIILLPYIFLNLWGNPRHSVGLLTALLLPLAIALPFLSKQLLPAIGQMLATQYISAGVELPALFWMYGALPVSFSFIGIFVLLRRGDTREISLLSGLTALLVVMLVFTQLHYGPETIYVRGLTSFLLILSIIAGAGLLWVRRRRLNAQCADKYKSILPWNFGTAFCALSMVLVLTTAIPARVNASFYHMVDDDDYHAFIWIKDHIGNGYETAIVDPWKATAFTGITGKKTPRRIWGEKMQADDMIYQFLGKGCSDTVFPQENRATFVYNQLPCDNRNLANVRRNVYVTNPNLTGSFLLKDKLQNASFESVYGNPPEPWSQSWLNCKPAFLFPEAGRNGGSCAAIHMSATAPFKPWPQAAWIQNILVQEGQTYYIGGWIMTENITGEGGAMIIAHWKGPDKSWVSVTNFMQYLKGTSDWTYYQGSVKAPPGAALCSIGPFMAACSGWAWFDDILFKPE